MIVVSKLPSFIKDRLSLTLRGNFADSKEILFIDPNSKFSSHSKDVKYIMSSPKTVITSKEAQSSCLTTSTKDSAASKITASMGISSPFSVSLRYSTEWNNSLEETVKTCKDISVSIDQEYENFLERKQGFAIEINIVNSWERGLLKNSFGLVAIPTGINRISIMTLNPKDSKFRLKLVKNNNTRQSGQSINLSVKSNGTFSSDLRLEIYYDGTAEDYAKEIVLK